MSSLRCVVPSCKYRRISKEGRSMFKCPAIETKAQIWADNIPGITTLHKRDFVCEAHFEPTCFCNTKKRKRIRNDAVPSIFFDCEVNNQSQNSPSYYEYNNLGANYSAQDFLELQITESFFDHDVFGSMPSYSAEQNTNVNQIPITQSPPYSAEQNTNGIQIPITQLPPYSAEQITNGNQIPITQLPPYFAEQNTNGYQIPIIQSPPLSAEQNTNGNQIPITQSQNANEDKSMRMKRSNSHLPKDNYQNNTKKNCTTTSLQEIVNDLSTSEQKLMEMKKEFNDEMPKMKNNRIEGCNARIKDEANTDNLEPTIYEKLLNNFTYYAAILPPMWSMSRLPLIGKNDILIFSKERTINENGALMVMFEKSIVLHTNGNMHYSIHGRDLKVKHPFTPETIKHVDMVLETISKFDSIKICKGVISKKIEIEKDQFVYKDDLGYCRHNNCGLIAEETSCRFCYNYSQYLLKYTIDEITID